MAKRPSVFSYITAIVPYLEGEDVYEWMLTCRTHFKDCYWIWLQVRSYSAIHIAIHKNEFHVDKKVTLLSSLHSLKIYERRYEVDFINTSSLFHFPKLLQYLKINLDELLPEDCLPNGLLHLSFGSLFDQPLPLLPSTLLYLEFGDRFRQSIVLPPNLTSLKLGCYFNQSIVFNQCLKKVEFGWCFNQVVECWPPLLTSLEFGNNFNKPVFDLPLTLKRLIFGKCFNKPLDLPNQLEYLVLGEKFQQPLILPLSLIQLTLHPSYPFSVPFANYDFQAGIKRARFTVENIMERWRTKKHEEQPNKRIKV